MSESEKYEVLEQIGTLRSVSSPITAYEIRSWVFWSY